MTQQLNFLNANRDFPFSVPKILPITNASLVVPSSTTSCYIDSFSDGFMYISCNLVRYAKGNIKDRSGVVQLYSIAGEEPVGWVTYDDLLPSSKEYLSTETALLDSCFYENNGLRIQVNGKSVYGDVQLLGGTNAWIFNMGSSIVVNFMKLPDIKNYLKSFNSRLKGNHVVIYGKDIIKINGNVFSTLANKVCVKPIINKGDKGPTGPEGEPGRSGNNSYGDYYPTPC